LKPEEIGQIAGRAGRYMNDGTFGVPAIPIPFDADLVQQVENHRYDPGQSSAVAQQRAGFLLARPACSRAWMRRRPRAD
jgi:ATP-dependent RNA helicase SUPV3L1/SUV3